MAEYKKPLPMPYADSKGYWEAAKNHELRVQKCSQCGHLRFPPSACCPKCLSLDHEWAKMSGKGEVYTFTVFHHVYGPEWASEVPYATCIIQLQEGPRILSNIVDCKPGEIYISMPVEVVFDNVTLEITLPKFKRAS